MIKALITMILLLSSFSISAERPDGSVYLNGEGNERGVSRIYLLGHSMGSRMSSAFVSTNPGHDLAGLIVIVAKS